jgi:hypothetical protein
VVPVGLSGSFELRYDEPRPLVELLGLGPNPPNPLSPGDLGAAGGELDKQSFRTVVALDLMGDPVSMYYEVSTPVERVADCVDGLAGGARLRQAGHGVVHRQLDVPPMRLAASVPRRVAEDRADELRGPRLVLEGQP